MTGTSPGELKPSGLLEAAREPAAVAGRHSALARADPQLDRKSYAAVSERQFSARTGGRATAPATQPARAASLRNLDRLGLTRRLLLLTVIWVVA